MSQTSGLEDGYRRLLAWYPRSFRQEQEEEMLAVLMAGAEPGQRRPRLRESADLLTGAARIRLGRAVRPGPAGQGRAQALAVFAVLTPVFLVIVAALEVAVPNHLPAADQHALYLSGLGNPPEIGGLPLLRGTFFDIATGVQVIVAALVLLGRRRLAVTAMLASAGCWAWYWAEGLSGIFTDLDALQLLTVSGCLIGGAALLVSPDSRPGHRLLTGRHWAVLLPVAALVQVTTRMLVARGDVTFTLSPHLSVQRPGITGYLAACAVLAAVTLVLAGALKLSWHFLLLLAILLYPYAIELASSGIFHPGYWDTDLLLRLPAPGNLTILLAPPILLTCGILLTTARPRRTPVTTPASRQA